MTRTRAMLPLHNLGCAGGSGSVIEHALRRVPGVSRVYANPVTEMVYVEYDADRCDVPRLEAVLDELGLGAGVSAQPSAGRPGGSAIDRGRVDAGRIALATGMWTGIVYVLVTGLAMLFTGTGVVVALPRPPAGPPSWWDFVVGAAEALLAGAIGGWLFAVLYNVVPRHRARRRSRSDLYAPPPTGGPP